MWADTLLAAERMHLMRILAWGALGVTAGSLVGVTLALRGVRAPLIRMFALQSGIWGAAELLMAALAWSALAEREYLAAVHLAGRMWMEVVLEVALILAGTIMSAVGWGRRRQSVVGSGIAVAVQGVALLAIDLPFLSLLRSVV